MWLKLGRIFKVLYTSKMRLYGILGTESLLISILSRYAGLIESKNRVYVYAIASNYIVIYPIRTQKRKRKANSREEGIEGVVGENRT